MAEGYFGVIDGMKAAWTNFRDREVLKWSLAMGIVTMVLGLAVTAMVGGSKDPTKFFAIFGVMMVLEIVAFIPILYFSMRMMRAGMTANGMKVSARMPSFVDFLVLHIRLFFINLFSWYEKKRLLPTVGLLIVGLLALIGGMVSGQGIVSLIAIPLLILALVAWMITIAIHSVYTMFGAYLFLRGDGPEGQMPYKSYQMVKGRGWPVFAAFAGSGLLTMLVAFIPLMVVGLIAGMASLAVSVLSNSTVLGALVEDLISLPLSVAFSAYLIVLQVSVFKFFDAMGPVVSKPAADTKKGSAAAAPAKTGKKK